MAQALVKLTFLGTGTSFGVPVIGCRCATCTSDDPRDKRTRHGAVVSLDSGRHVLVDTPPELRLQLLRAGIDRVDAIWYTHCHADHVHGVDDLRVFTTRCKSPLPAYAPEPCAETLLARFAYVFDESVAPPEGSTKPSLQLHTLRHAQRIEVAGSSFLALAVPHGDVQSFGFRVGDLGYITDAKSVPHDIVDALRGVDVLVLNALWIGKSHPTHLTVAEAVAVAETVGSRRTYLTHLTHRVRHAELSAQLPAGILPAHDGLSVEILSVKPADR
ncbi:MAG: MBL fold metallo-hydrolase [Gemmatimonadetes bacterium]|nr:MBL fold metallo-hydrolase [Gemmatimonadota bacterium]